MMVISNICDTTYIPSMKTTLLFLLTMVFTSNIIVHAQDQSACVGKHFTYFKKTASGIEAKCSSTEFPYPAEVALYFVTIIEIARQFHT